MGRTNNKSFFLIFVLIHLSLAFCLQVGRTNNIFYFYFCTYPHVASVLPVQAVGLHADDAGICDYIAVEH